MIAAAFGGAGGQIFCDEGLLLCSGKRTFCFDYSQILFSALMGIFDPGAEAGCIQYPGISDHLCYGSCNVFYNKNRSE